MKWEELSGGARERLEEASLSALMERYAEEEGAGLLEEARALNGETDFSYPEALDAAVARAADRHFKREKRRPLRNLLRPVSRAAAAALAAGALGWAVLGAGDPDRLETYGGRIDTPFEVLGALFVLVFVLALGVIAATLFRGLREWTRNNAAPRLTVGALVTARRESVTHRPCGAAGDPSGAHGYHSARHTRYYATFQVESGDRMEFPVSGAEYGRLAEGDTGRLTFQGTRYLGFQRTDRG